MPPVLAALLLASSVDLRLELTRESLVGTHLRYRQYINGLPVAGGEVNVSPDGRTETLAVVDQRTVASMTTVEATHAVNVDGVARFARRVVEGDALRPVAVYYDVDDGSVLRVEPLYFNAKPARVFTVNPVAKTGIPFLSDENDSASAVPASAYTEVLLDVADSGPLRNAYVRVVDIENPAIPPHDASQSLLLDREHDGFEDVNAVYHVDKTQQYLQSLGYTGARQLVAYPIPVDPHGAGGADNSFYVGSIVAGRGQLIFGDGGTDDAEDSDLVVHEYGHAVLDWISPLTFTGSSGSQARALAEGFGDYLAFSQHFAESNGTNRSAACFADWDARCFGDDPSQRCSYPADAECLRRMDSPKTMADYIASDAAGTEHQNGEIWSAAMRDLFLAMRSRTFSGVAKRMTDTLAVEAFFGAPPSPTFAGIARRMIAVDRLLFNGQNVTVICSVMSARRILSAADCGIVPRGERTLLQSQDQGIAIPDSNSGGIVSRLIVTDTRRIEDVRVRVDIEHSSRGDLRLVLVAPDGTSLVLQNVTLSRDSGLHATYGLDAQPVDSLDTLRGRTAAGEWQLRVSDLRSQDVGVLVSWGLDIRFQGETPLTQRPTAASRRIIPVVGHVRGLTDTFVTDLRLFNRGSRTANVTLVYTPSGADGRTTFGATRIQIAPSQVFALDDVVFATLQQLGLGHLELQGDVDNLVIFSRTHTTGEQGDGTLGETIPAVDVREATTEAWLTPIQRDASVRTNVGVAEVAGVRGFIRIAVFDAATGREESEVFRPIEPFGHVQLPVIPVDGRLKSVFISVASGESRLVAYGSRVDNITGDAMHLQPLKLSIGFAVAPGIHAPGLGGSFWRTDVWGMAGLETNVTPFIFYKDNAEEPRARDLNKPREREVLYLPDVAAAFRPGVATIGAMGFSSGLQPIMRIYTAVPGGGTLGQAVVPQRGIARSYDVLFAETGGAMRMNVGILRISSIPGIAFQARITVYDAGGRELARRFFFMAPQSIAQMPLESLVSEPVTNGRVRFELFDSETFGFFLGYASLVDNRSGDPSYLPGQ